MDKGGTTWKGGPKNPRGVGLEVGAISEEHALSGVLPFLGLFTEKV